METLRIHEDVALYYLTFSVIEWLPVFVSEEPCLIVAESLILQRDFDITASRRG